MQLRLSQRLLLLKRAELSGRPKALARQLAVRVAALLQVRLLEHKKTL